ncbi:MAG: glycolate oxidase subunit GlcE [Gammaproteobacteria bacterium]|nr:glycolate oxidase subunit GlcE [Gammaproteobacteria bacterium]MBU1414632.1 glycolate oxidase subunit GlcE [Gammaproteobacteria bacterium]
MADLTEQFKERISVAGADRPLCIRGGGSKDFYGETPRGEILDTRGHAGITDYEPTELVITARCGTPLAEIEAALAAENQCLAFEPPHFAHGTNSATSFATVGGAVAAGLSGPRRAAVGALRDFVLGVTILSGVSRRLTFGGQVMKNVAGYDVSRLMAGSLGTLGLILEVSLKVLPRPVAEATLRFDLPQAKALEALNAWAGKPLPISGSCWHEDVLTLRLSGAEAAVAAAKQKLGGELLADASTFWNDLREQRHEFFAGTETLWRLSVPSVAPVLDLPGEQVIEWGGSQRWWRGDAAVAREAATKVGGHAVLFRGTDKSAGVFQPLPAPLLKIHQRLKAAFDPRGVFNPGRLYPNL